MYISPAYRAALLASWFRRRGIPVLLGEAMVVSGILLCRSNSRLSSRMKGPGSGGARHGSPHADFWAPHRIPAAWYSLFRGSLDASSDIRPWADLNGITSEEGSAGGAGACLFEER